MCLIVEIRISYMYLFSSIECLFVGWLIYSYTHFSIVVV